MEPGPLTTWLEHFCSIIGRAVICAFIILLAFQPSTISRGSEEGVLWMAWVFFIQSSKLANRIPGLREDEIEGGEPTAKMVILAFTA